MNVVADDVADRFDWRVFADATAAGLTALIPIPLLDVFLEGTFRRRMPGAIAQARGSWIETRDRVALSRGQGWGLSLAGCLAVPVKLIRYILTKLWRKILYVFAVTDATKQVAEYWNRAYLIDHMVRLGHLEKGADTDRAIEAFYRVVPEIDPSPLWNLAKEVVAASHRVIRTLFRARKEGTAATLGALGTILAEHWDAAVSPLEEVAQLYDKTYREVSSSDDVSVVRR